MLRRGTLLLTLMGCTLALGLAGTNPVLAQATQERECATGPLDGTFSSPCLDCDLEITGSARACLQLVTSSNGTQILTFQAQGSAKGTDCNGNEYVINVNEHANVNLITDATGAATIPLKLNVISLGSAPDIKCHMLLHVTRNANGDLTVAFEKIGEDCECVE